MIGWQAFQRPLDLRAARFRLVGQLGERYGLLTGQKKLDPLSVQCQIDLVFIREAKTDLKVPVLLLDFA